MRILIIDDEPNICAALSGLLEDAGYQTITSVDASAGLAKAVEETVDIIFLDVRLPGLDGLQILERIKNIKPDQQVIMISGEADLETAVRATRLGAYNFLEKPLNPDKVLLEVKNIERQQQIMREVFNLKKLVEYDYRLVGTSPALEKVREEIRKSAPTDGRILIYGENGTGKELVAREIHQQSLRKNGPFVKVNCAAIPKDLIESELFGHEKGAFTGAVRRKYGMFEEADGGTLLLDEIGDLSLESQAKLLRVLQENEFQRVGGTKPIKFNTRIISATNKNLQEEINRGKFREDLYFRLNVIPIRIPPLRERKEDIPVLVRYFLKSYSIKNGKREKHISEEALASLMDYQWPGNVRELKNFIERLVIMTDCDDITLENVKSIFPDSTIHEKHDIEKEFDFFYEDGLSLRQIIENFEKQLLKKEYEKADCNVSRLAAKLKTDRPNLHRKLKKYGIKI